MNQKASPVRYSLAMLGLTIPTQAFAAFLLYFYVDSMGLVVGAWAVIRTIYSVYDALCNPLFGYLSDRTRTRWGRRRPWLVTALPLYLIAFVFIFWIPAPLRQGSRLFWYALLAILVHDSLNTILWDNYSSLFPELFKGLHERSRVNALRQAFQILGLVVGIALSPVVYTKLGFAGMALVYAALAGVLVGLSFWGNREDPDAVHASPMPPLAAFKTTLSNGAFWVYAGVTSLTQLAFGVLVAGMPFYAKYSLKLSAAETTYLFGAVFGVALPMVALWAWIARRWGGKRAWLLAVGTLALSALPLTVAQGLAGGIVVGAVVGLGFSGVLVMGDVVMADVIDRDAEATGQRREGVYYSVNGFIVRLSGLLQGAAFWLAQVFYGYVNGEHPGPNPGAAFRFLMTTFPFVAVTVAVWVGRRYPRQLKEPAEERAAVPAS